MCQCNQNHSSNEKCFESRLSLGVKEDGSAIVGSLDRVSITPIPLKRAVQQNETVTTLKYDPDLKAIVYANESVARTGGTPDTIETREILSGANIAGIGGVGELVEGGVALVTVVDNVPQVIFSVPKPVEVGEIANGFITYVANPNDGSSYLKTVQPSTDGVNDSVLIGRANGDIEFSTPIASLVVIPVDDLTSDGIFNGTPSTASGTWRYQLMGTSPVVSNTSGSPIEVTLNFRYSLVTAGSHSGVYASLLNGGADYKTTFISGISNEKQEGYPGGYAQFIAQLDPNQKVQFNFGAWTNASGNMEVTIGSLNEVAGTTTKIAQAPTIRIRRLI